MNLKTLCFTIWESKYTRQGISSQYKPFYSRYIGVDNSSEYPNILKTLYMKSEKCPYSVFFDRSVPMQAEFDLITYLSRELKSMDVHNLKSQDIVLFNDEETNKTFLNSLDEVINLALNQETFVNENSRNDFIIKVMVWIYSYICPMQDKFDASNSPKCFYYGDITKHEVYFLMLLHKMGFDVVYINPLRNEVWDDVDKSGESEVVTSPQILAITPIADIMNSAKEIREEQSITLQLQREMEDTLLSGSGVYRSWQFRDGSTKALFIRSTVIDLLNNYNEPARVRNGFQVDGSVVTVPNYLFQIDGLNSNMQEYHHLLEVCTKSPNTKILTDKGESLLGTTVSDSEKLKLAFCKLSDGHYDIEELKKLSYYKWDRYRDSLEDFILNKINDLLDDCMYKKQLSKEEEFSLVCDILSMDESVIKMADNFDFTDKIPKIVIFLEKEDFVPDRVLYLLGFIVTLGFDVVIFNPSGLMSIDSVFQVARFNYERLDTMKYDCTFESIKKKKGFFKNLFKS